MVLLFLLHILAALSLIVAAIWRIIRKREPHENYALFFPFVIACLVTVYLSLAFFVVMSSISGSTSEIKELFGSS